MLFPVPPFDIQQRIVGYIKGTRRKFSQIEDEINESWKKASKEIEKVLIR